MPVQYKDLISVLATICEERNLVASVSETLTSGLLSGIFTIAGGLIFGRPGIFLGAVIGGGLGALNSSHNLKPVSEIIKNMPDQKKKELQQKIKNAFRDFGVADIATLGAVIMSQQNLKDIAIREVSRYLTSEMGYSITAA